MDDKRVLVVGGGIIGLAIGWRLARAGRAVTVFDRDYAGRAASWASAGMLTPLAEVQHEEEELLHLGLAGLAQFPEFVNELEAETGCSVGYRQDGVLLVGVTQDDVEYLKFRYTFQRDLGLSVEWFSGGEAREKEPHLSAQVSAAVWCPGDHQVDNRRFVEALRKGFLQAGGSIPLILRAGATNGSRRTRNPGTSRRVLKVHVGLAAIQSKVMISRPSGQGRSRRSTRCSLDFAHPSVHGAASG